MPLVKETTREVINLLKNYGKDWENVFLIGRSYEIKYKHVLNKKHLFIWTANGPFFLRYVLAEDERYHVNDINWQYLNLWEKFLMWRAIKKLPFDGFMYNMPSEQEQVDMLIDAAMECQKEKI